MLKQHHDSGADVTLATIQMDPAEVSRFGVVDMDRDHRVIGFLEKPQQTELRSPYNPSKVSASMGIYLLQHRRADSGAAERRGRSEFQP